MKIYSILKTTAAIATFALTSFAGIAQDTDTIDTSPKELIPVEVRAIRTVSLSPFAATNLYADEIRKQHTGQDIPYILQYTPSVLVNSDAGTGIGYTDLRVRGTDNSRINFTLNGIPLNDPESQGTFFVDFPDLMSSTSSLQVQRGVGSSTNGPGAFGASVNISNMDQSDTAYAELVNSYGSFNTWRHMLRAGSGHIGKGFQFDVRLSRQKSDGYIERSYADLRSLQFIAGWESKSEKTSVKFNLMTGTERTGQSWNGVPGDSLAANRRYNELGIKADGSYFNDQSDNFQQDYYQLFFNHQFDDAWSVNVAGYLTRGKGFYNEYRLDESFSDYGLNDFITPAGDTFSSLNLTRQLWLDNYNYGLVYALNYFKDKTGFILGGTATRFDNRHYGYITWADYGVPEKYRWYDLAAFKTDINVYAKWQQHFAGHFFLYADLQLRHVNYEIGGFRKNPTVNVDRQYTFLNPKIGLSYWNNYPGVGATKAFVSFAIANKEPNRDDFEASPADLPESERLYDVEAGYELNGNKFSGSLNLYYMQYKDQLILTGKINDVGAYTRTNVPRSYRAGIELAAVVTPDTWLRFDGNLTLSQNRIQAFTEYYDDYDNGGQVAIEHSNTDIALSPNTIAALGLSANIIPGNEIQALWLELNGKYLGRQFLDNTSNTARSIDPFGLLNLRIRYTLHPRWMDEVGMMLSVNNLFDTKYETKGYTYSYLSDATLTTANYYFPQAGINYSIGLSLRW